MRPTPAVTAYWVRSTRRSSAKTIVVEDAAPAADANQVRAGASPSQPVGPTGAPTPQASARRGAARVSASVESRTARVRVGMARVYAAGVRALAIGLLLMGACAAAEPAPRLVPVTAAAPLLPIAYPLIDGGMFESAQLAGEVAVLDVWASYCQPCKKSFPRLNALAQARPDVRVIGLSIDTEEAPMRAFLAEVPATFAIARDAGETSIGPPLHIRKVPTVFLIDRQGRVRLRLEEPTPADYDALPALVDALRAER